MTENPPETQERVPLVPSKAQVWRNFFRHAVTALGVLLVSGLVCGGLYEWVRPTDITPFSCLKSYFNISNYIDDNYGAINLFLAQIFLFTLCILPVVVFVIVLAYLHRYQKRLPKKIRIFIALLVIGLYLGFATFSVASMARDNYSQLHLAASRGFTERARLFIFLGSDVNKQDKNTCTPLDYAIWNANVDTARLLIRHGSHISQRDGFLLGFRAKERKACDLADLYLESFGTIETVLGSSDGRRMLHVAICMRNAVLVRHLIEKESNVNALDFLGNSPLHLAVRFTSQGSKEGVECVKLLLEHGAYCNARDSEGKTPFDLATRDDVKQLLRIHGGLTGQELSEKMNPETSVK